ncbi:MAG: stage III sporulation protein AE [Christensenellaceae bacterium]|jgi:stage III sporulation protein AE|nr:stage III sporulation protein AE [Christensenellaceae bacterium]
MKKPMLMVAIMIVFLIVLFFNTSIAYAHSDSESELNDEIQKELDQILLKGDFEKFFAEIENEHKFNFGGSFREAVEKILRGDASAVSEFFNVVLQAISGNIPTVIFDLSVILVLALLYSLSKNLNSGFLKASTNNVIYYIIYSSVIAILCIIVVNSIILVKRVINIIAHLTEIAFPILLTLSVAIGGTATASSYSSITLIFSEVVLKVSDKIIMPLYIASTVFTFISCLTKGIKLNRITNGIGAVMKWIMGGMFGLIISVTAARGIVGAAIDGITVRTAKFAVSSYVPIIGGYLSDGFDIITASAVLLKNSIGLCALIVLFLSIVKPITEIIITSLALKIAAGITETIGADGISDVLQTTSKNLGTLSALILSCLFCASLMIIGLISSFNGVV